MTMSTMQIAGTLGRLARPHYVPRTLLQFRYDAFFLLRLLSGRVLARSPLVHGFNCNEDSPLIQKLRSVNTIRPTRMCRVMTKYGSDKGRMRHNYTTVYSALFASYQDRPLRIFELGLGTNNRDIPSNVGTNGRPSASLRGWRELFPRAFVYGADIDRRILFSEDGIAAFYCDQLDQTSIRELWTLADLAGGMDIIIEDGLHTFEANVSFLEGSLERVRPGGVYVVEDIRSDTIQKWRTLLETDYSRRYPAYEFAFVMLPNLANRQDNNLLVVHRKN